MLIFFACSLIQSRDLDDGHWTMSTNAICIWWNSMSVIFIFATRSAKIIMHAFIFNWILIFESMREKKMCKCITPCLCIILQSYIVFIEMYLIYLHLYSTQHIKIYTVNVPRIMISGIIVLGCFHVSILNDYY